MTNTHDDRSIAVRHARLLAGLPCGLICLGLTALLPMLLGATCGLETCDIFNCDTLPFIEELLAPDEHTENGHDDEDGQMDMEDGDENVDDDAHDDEEDEQMVDDEEMHEDDEEQMHDDHDSAARGSATSARTGIQQMLREFFITAASLCSAAFRPNPLADSLAMILPT